LHPAAIGQLLDVPAQGRERAAGQPQEVLDFQETPVLQRSQDSLLPFVRKHVRGRVPKKAKNVQKKPFSVDKNQRFL
jgi:hypothetical protein